MPFPSAVSGMVSRALEEVLRTSTLLGWDSSADIPEVPEDARKSPKKPDNLSLLESATTTSASGRTISTGCPICMSTWVG